MADKCLTRIENVLKKSSIATEKAEGILADIKKAQGETKITDLDETITSKLADGVLKRQAPLDHYYLPKEASRLTQQ